jgi:putative phosphotransacetylase
MKEGSADRLGNLLTGEEGVSKEQLERALERQAEYRKANVPLRLGEVIVDSGVGSATKVSDALHRQRDGYLRSSTIGQVLLELEYVTRAQLEEAMEAHLDILAPLGEVLVEQGICSQEQVDTAYKLQLIRRVCALRRPLSSHFDPLNVMELLVEETVDGIIEKKGGCTCDQCRANVVAISLNKLAARYMSDMEALLGQLDRYREEYGELVGERIAKAVEQVKESPKLGCRKKARAPVGEMLGRVVVHISNRHVHLTQEHVERLFGPGYGLTKWKDLVQPGQYAARETVVLEGPKGTIERVRVLGPPRSASQVEISGTDQFKLGLKAPVRESGKLDGTPGIDMAGSHGNVSLEHGVIRARRHIHMTPEDGGSFGLKNGDSVNVRLKGDRTAVCESVLVRITDTSALEMHIDTDEANAAGVPMESLGEVLHAG